MKDLLGLTPRPRIVAICAGAGWSLARALMETPGASEYLVEVQLPYDEAATAHALGFDPRNAYGKGVCAATSKAMATEAYMRATLRAQPGELPIGLGMTASIASLREHRGQHECWASVVGDGLERDVHMVFRKDVGQGSRAANEAECSATATGLLLGCVTKGTRDLEVPPYPSATPGDVAFMARPYFDGISRGAAAPPGVILFPGAFDPLHEGHEAVANEVERMTGRPVVYCIERATPHKTRLTVQQMATRAARVWSKGAAVLFTEGEPLYIDKARARPGTHFVIGVDAALRMLDPKWGPHPVALLQELTMLNARFYVAPRVVDGVERNILDVLLAIDKIAHKMEQPNVSTYGALFGAVHVAASAQSSTALRERAAS